VNTNTALSRGLRNVLIYVHLGGVFPPLKSSPEDVALLRGAKLAMRRRENGVTDAFLFVIVGAKRSSEIDEAISAYGFPAIEIQHIEDRPQDSLIANIDAPQETVGTRIADWLAKKHPGAIAFPTSSYDGECFWWVGVEHADSVYEWPFEISDFASELPETHNAKAETWLTILAEALDLAEMHATTPEILGQQRSAVAAATLCEWLHGFEAASGNGYNHFEQDSTIKALQFSPLFLGYEAAQLHGGELDEFCDEYDIDIDDLGNAALTAITSGFRATLRRELSAFFGSDSSLFWVLHSTIWPTWDLPMRDAINDLLNRDDLDYLDELQMPWSFVADGWCDAADQ